MNIHIIKILCIAVIALCGTGVCNEHPKSKKHRAGASKNNTVSLLEIHKMRSAKIAKSRFF